MSETDTTTMSEPQNPETPETPAPRPLPHWACALFGAGAAVLGLLPWLVTGMRLPLQNLWGSLAGPEQMPLVLLPFSQYYLGLIVGFLVTGAAAAGIVARATRQRLPRGGFGLIVVGLLAVQVGATAQTAVTVNAGLAPGADSALYLAVLVAVSILSILVGVLAFALIARAPRAGALIGLTIGAIAVSPWLSGFLQSFAVTNDLSPIVSLIPWISPVLVGVAIAWAGIGSVGRAIAAIASVVMVWILPALLNALAGAAGMRVYARMPAELADYAVSVFLAMAFTPDLALRPIIATIVVAAVGLAVRWALGRRARTEKDAADPAPPAA